MCRIKHLKIVRTNDQITSAEPDELRIGPSYLTLKGAVLTLDNALAINMPSAVIRRRKDLCEAVEGYKKAKKTHGAKSQYESKLISLGDELLPIAGNLLQISSLSLLSSLVLL